MFSVLRRSCGRNPRSFTRSFAEIVPATPTRTSTSHPPLKGTIDPPPPGAIAGPGASQSISSSESKVVSPVRLGNRVPVRDDHGLYAFFRKKEPEPGQRLVGEAKYETLGGSRAMESARSGRSWKASELRLKSFEDLHTLWYILLREQNLLATQREEVRRLGVMRILQSFNVRVRMCRKSMARIKYVMNERRLAYEGAVTLAEEGKKAHITNLVLEQQLTDHQKERKRLLIRQGRVRQRLAAQQEAAAKKQAEPEAAEGQDSSAVETKTDAAPEVSVQTSQPSETSQPEASVPAPKTQARRNKPESASEAAAAGLFGTSGRRR